MTARDPRARRAERIRERVLELLEAGRIPGLDLRIDGLTARSLSAAMVDLLPGTKPSRAEVGRALNTLRVLGKVRYEGGLWRLA